ncbi:hypothetical protein [Caudoviricetes sp.]|nr:hypothetical protein [Caudoviricetes sp.]
MMSIIILLYIIDLKIFRSITCLFTCLFTCLLMVFYFCLINDFI